MNLHILSFPQSSGGNPCKLSSRSPRVDVRRKIVGMTDWKRLTRRTAIQGIVHGSEDLVDGDVPIVIGVTGLAGGNVRVPESDDETKLKRAGCYVLT
jgi:hypothetical protein